MFKLDNNFLTSLGLGALPVEEKNKLLQHIYERLEMNVGMKLAEKMTDAQLDEFESFIDRNDEAGALRWLETNFPNYKEVVAEELEKLKKEVSEAAPHILAAAQSQQLDAQTQPENNMQQPVAPQSSGAYPSQAPQQPQPGPQIQPNSPMQPDYQTPNTPPQPYTQQPNFPPANSLPQEQPPVNY